MALHRRRLKDTIIPQPAIMPTTTNSAMAMRRLPPHPAITARHAHLKKFVFRATAPQRSKSKLLDLSAFIHPPCLSWHGVLPLNFRIALHLHPISLSTHELKYLLLTIVPELSRIAKPKPYVCLHSGCETSFTRPFDLGRHMKTTHQAGVRIDCPEGWCGRSGLPDGREKGGFSRADHFYEHVSKVHRKVVVKDENNVMYVRSPDGRESEVRVTNP